MPQTLHDPTHLTVASRVRKARRASTCPVCREPIRPGQQIAMLGRWQHVEHVIEQQRQQPATATEDR